MIRARFYVNKEKCEGDFRPVKWPIKYPYWCTGEGYDYFVLVAYADSIDELTELWPEASNIDSADVGEISFSDRFPKPEWYKGSEDEEVPLSSFIMTDDLLKQRFD